ncbi:SAM-dependent methyltransferase [Thermodesulfobacteriota bacterium]
MRNKGISSAEKVTMARAFESSKAPEVRVCNDEIAVHFLGGKSKLLYRILINPWLRRVFVAVTGSPLPMAIAGYVALRTRFIDEQLQACIADGLEQLVVLGAGYDSRAYRFDELKDGIKAFEVDHPWTQDNKLSKIEKLFGSVPDYVTYVPVDFEKDDLNDELIRNGYDGNLRTLFIWEGVSYYLDPEAVDQTLAFASNISGPGSSIVFDYLPLDVVNRASRLPLAREFVDYVEEMGEPCKFGIESGGIEEFLSQRALSPLRDFSVQQCRQAYHTPANKDTPVLSIFHIVHAETSP